MLQSAIQKASFHIERAKRAFGSIPAIYEGDFSGEWADFLNAGNSVYESLGKGTKGNPRSRQWFGGKKRERRTDSLLNYMHQARNASEHGLHLLLELGPEPRGENVLVLMHGEWTTKRDNEGIWAIGRGADGKRFKARLTPPDYRLLKVYDDRSETWHNPPTKHLGKPLVSNTPVAVGKLWLAYLEVMIVEATSLASPAP